MEKFTLYLGNKNYSSWSLRAWLAAKQTGARFEEAVIPLFEADWRERVLAASPSGRVPALHHGDRVIWESLAIIEYLDELFPRAMLWPEDGAARALARSVSAEMHAGFSALREHMPMNLRRRSPHAGRAPGVAEDITRIVAIWEDCRRRFGASGGPLLFGHFSAADAMFAPVVTRFRTYEVDLPPAARAYMDAVWALPAMQEWAAAAHAEPWAIAKYDL